MGESESISNRSQVLSRRFFLVANSVITAEERNNVTKSDVRKARDQGKIPAVVYGKKVPSVRVYIDEKEFNAMMKTTGSGGVIRIQLPKYGEQSVMINELQKDPMLNRIMHIDFHQIDLNEQVKATVRIELVGQAKGASEGGIVQQLSATVDVRCMAGNIPTAIEADVTNLELGDHFYVRDLVMPEGVEIKSDPNDLIATVLAPQKELPETAAEEREDFIRQEAEKSDEVLER
jgi:large subunit ribosomal protein L25